MPDPIYTADNVRIAYELRWSLAVFWTSAAPAATAWLPPLQKATEPDGVRILEHRFTKNNVSQFLISTKPHVGPAPAFARAEKGDAALFAALTRLGRTVVGVDGEKSCVPSYDRFSRHVIMVAAS